MDLRLQRMLEAFMENDGEDGYFPALWRQEEADTGIPFDSADAVSYGDDGLPLNAQGEPVFRPDDTPVYEQDGTTLLRGSSAQPNADGVHTLVFYRNIRKMCIRDRIIPYQELLGNYNYRRDHQHTYGIIPYQELLGNYNALLPDEPRPWIIPYQELLGNYN